MFPYVFGHPLGLPGVYPTQPTVQTLAQNAVWGSWHGEMQGLAREELRPTATSSQENLETIHSDSFSNTSLFRKSRTLGVLQKKVRAQVMAQALMKRKCQLLAVLGVNGKQGVGPRRNATSQQSAFTVQMDEPCGEREKEFLSLKKVQCEDKRWDFNSAVSLPATSRPLVPCNQTMDVRFEASLPLETSMKLEAPRKLPNIMEVSDYAEDIYLYLREMEVKFKLNVDYMKNQPDTIENLRVLLLNWLVVAGQLLELQNETLHLAVNYFNRYLSLEPVSPETLQLLGIAALRLATKFEEAYPLRIIQLIHHRAGQYTKKQISEMECRMLQVLAFHLALPTINQFLTQYFLHQQQPNPHVESLAMFLGELCLVDTVTYLKYLPSVTAGAAFHLALYTVTGKSWPESLVQKTGYTLETLKPCLMDLHWTYFSTSQHAVYSIPEKYRKPMYHGVAHIPPPETLNLE